MRLYSCYYSKDTYYDQIFADKFSSKLHEEVLTKC